MDIFRAQNRAFLRARGVVPELRSSTEPTLDALREAGLRDHELAWLARERDVCAANAGLYIVEGRLTDSLPRFARRHGMLTVGLTTALWLHRLLDARPPVDHWMIDHAKWRPIWLPPKTQVHLSRNALDDTVMMQLDGITVRVAGHVRAVLDCIRFRAVLGEDVAVHAVKSLRDKLRYELPGLRERARAERLEKPLLRILEELGEHWVTQCPVRTPVIPPSMAHLKRQSRRGSSGTELAFVTAGDPAAPAVLLLHGLPNSASGFRDVIPELSKVAYVIAPDLPGFGESEPLPEPTFEAYGDLVLELLGQLNVGKRYVYLHDFGAPVGFHVAMKRPEALLGLIIQNANAHRTGFGPQWQQTFEYWAQPDAEHEAAATGHLSREGTRDTYLSGLPPDLAARIDPQTWKEDWRVMRLPGRMATQRALLRDYGRYAERFDAIAAFLAERQPPALMVWGRHDPFFELAEVVSWMKALPRMEAHILDAGHMLLETHAREATELMLRFIQRTAPSARPPGEKGR